MSDPTTVVAMTNTTPNSCVKVTCDCNTMWSFVQQMSYLRLSTETGDFKAKLLTDYAVRARRIAATYARFYLELEDGGDVNKKGRFYWAALAAFASKTVACTMESMQVQVLSVASKTTKEGLGKGNFWLFCDISGWHWYYCKYPGTFDMCASSRNAENYAPAVKQQMDKLPWKAVALPKIKNMQISKEIAAGFKNVKSFEIETSATKRSALQMEHLLNIANHEQGVILQPLIYDDENFSYWVKLQRNGFVNWASPRLALVFSEACSTDNSKYMSVAPDDTVLENLQSRMYWITKAANQFHKLMGDYSPYMGTQLAIIASWVDKPDVT